ncbi:hypothetical protein G9A89_001865 [Geosiphon pyriformis]|nr:hypothetical protein G9A89_001865 [Geosiphon pyriformis]
MKHLTGLPAVLLYGDNLLERAFENSTCMIAQKISGIFNYPTQIIPGVLAFYLWYSLAKKDVEIEKRCQWYVSVGIWGVSIITRVLRTIDDSKKLNWNVEPNRLMCQATSNDNFLSFIVPAVIVFILATFFTFDSSKILMTNWQLFSLRQNRRTAFNLGHAVRLTVFSLAYLIILCMFIVPVVIRKIKNASDAKIYTTSQYSTTALFLPCFYYAPHDAPKRKKSVNLFKPMASDPHPLNFIISHSFLDPENTQITTTTTTTSSN